MKGGTCDVTKHHLKILNNNLALVSLYQLEIMNERWKNHTIISFATMKKTKMDSFISWYKWIEDALNDDVLKRYQLLQLKNNRSDKTTFNSDLYSDF